MYSERNLLNWFTRNWSNRPLFRTVLTLALLIIIHALILNLEYPGFAFTDWLRIWSGLLRDYAGIGIVALGMTLVIACGVIDLSAGAGTAAVSAASALLTETGGHGLLRAAGIYGPPAYAASVCAGIIFGAMLGQISGILVTRGKAPPFIATLGTMIIYRGIAQQLMAGVTPVIPEGFRQIALFEISGGAFLPVVYWLALSILLHIVLNHTVFGRYVIATGSNEKAARLAGISVDRVKRRVYRIMGVMTAITALLQVAGAGAPNFANAGSGYATDAITACVLGGSRLGGGRGHIAGAVMGTLIIAVVNHLQRLTGVSPYMGEAFKGIVIIVAVLLYGAQSTSGDKIAMK
ncbi:MAG: ABC transporter permease [Clostridiales bacterium]|jgi:ribose transport system permease protein|nr:ABC transporter permease [Clostridiales bacterium]